jgi:predicted GNAT superfamily acetyltransferase
MSKPKQMSDAIKVPGHEKDARGDAKQFRIAPVTKLVDFESCVEVQLAVWSYSDGDLIPKRVFIVAQRIGGQVLGAYDGNTLVGFAMAFPGYRDGKPYLHSHMLAVLPQYRNVGLGQRLKLAQRDDALARGIDRMDWTFDPLEIKNAHLNSARLGAIARLYMRNIYGPSTSPLQGGLPTDRLVVEWWLKSERVRRALGEETAGEETGERATAADEVVERIDVPCIIHDWKRDPQRRTLAESLQTRNRLILESAFARGLAIIGYERCANGDGFFLLGRVSGL